MNLCLFSLNVTFFKLLTHLLFSGSIQHAHTHTHTKLSFLRSSFFRKAFTTFADQIYIFIFFPFSTNLIQGYTAYTLSLGSSGGSVDPENNTSSPSQIGCRCMRRPHKLLLSPHKLLLSPLLPLPPVSQFCRST